MAYAATEGYVVTQIWDNGKKTKLETEIIEKKDFGMLVKIGSFVEIPIESWPALRTKINQLFLEIKKQQENQ